MTTEDHLKNCQFCNGLDEKELKALSSIARTRKVVGGATLFSEGDRADGFFALLSGRVRIFKSSPAGKEYTIHRIQPGQIFAEVAIFGGGHFPAHCEALEDSLVAFFPKNSFLKLIEGSPQISLKIIGSLAAFLREYNLKLENLSLKEVPARIASFLLQEAERAGPVITLDISKSEWAHSLGTISETLSRALRKLKELEIITVDNKLITILDRDRLAGIASGEKLKI
jgi:CRP/FNR family transcriptional regulator